MPLLNIAGVISLEDGLRLIAIRGQLMQSISAGGGMAAIMANEEQIKSLLPEGILPEQIEIAAINGPENTVISGDLRVLNTVVSQLQAQGLRARLLNVSHAFHSVHVEPMLAEFEQVARGISFYPPTIDFISSMTGKVANTEVTQPDYWIRQIRQPVQFAMAIETLVAQSAEAVCSHFIEIGPQPTLIALGQACVDSLSVPLQAPLQMQWLPSLALEKRNTAGDPITPRSDWKTILSSLGRFYEAGGAVDWAGVDKSYPRQQVLLPNYPFERQRYWLEPEIRSPKRFGASLAVSQVDHPLLGRSLLLASHRIRCFEAQLQPNEPLKWSDHTVFGTALMPAAAYLEIAIAAGKEIFDNSYCLTQVSFHKGLWLTPDALQLQTVVTHLDSKKAEKSKRSEERFEFEISSLDSVSQGTGQWISHVTGILAADWVPPVENVDLADIQQRLPDCRPAAQLYQQFSAKKIDY